LLFLSILDFSSHLCYRFSMLNYTVLRSRRRTVALEVTKDGRLLVRAPLRYPEREIRRFVASHEVWAIDHLEQQRQRQAAAPPPPTPAEIDALKQKAWEVLPSKVEQYGRQMGLIPTGLRITTARSRFGSCSARNSLCFSCFLMNYPDEAVDLVVVHELAHIRQKNHGPLFYALIEEILPDYRERKKLLRQP